MARMFSEAFTSATNGTGARVKAGTYMVSASGGVGTFKLQCSHDGGTNYFDVSMDAAGTPTSWSLSGSTMAVTGTVPPGIDGLFMRFVCTAYTSGTIAPRFDQ